MKEHNTHTSAENQTNFLNEFDILLIKKLRGSNFSVIQSKRQ